jgi:hypothetical protein
MMYQVGDGVIVTNAGLRCFADTGTITEIDGSYYHVILDNPETYHSDRWVINMIKEEGMPLEEFEIELLRKDPDWII